MSDEEIQSAIEKEYPRSGEDVAFDVDQVKNAALEGQSSINPFDAMSNDDYVLYRKHLADKKTSLGDALGIAKDTFGHIIDEVGTGIGATAYTLGQGDVAKAAESAGSGMVAGTVGLIDLASKILKPAQPIPTKEDFIGKRITRLVDNPNFPNAYPMEVEDTNTEDDYKKLIESEKQRDADSVNNIYAMELTMRGAPVEEIARGFQYVDPSILAGAASTALKTGASLFSKMGAKAAAGTALRATAPSAVEQAGLSAIEGTAGAIQGAASIPSRVIQGVGQVAEAVMPGTSVGAKAAALTGAAMSDAGLTAGVIGGAKATEKVAEVAGAIARIAKQEASRAGKLERVALDPNVSAPARRFAAGLAQIQPIASAAGRMAGQALKEGAKGAVVGGVIGGLAERNLEGVAAGAGAGTAFGGMFGAMHSAFDLGKEVLGRSTSRTRQQATGDINTFISTRPEIEQGAWADTMNKLVAKVGPERAASQMDAMQVAEAAGSKVRIATLDEINQGLAPGWLNVATNEIVLNPAKILADTASHEATHAIFNSVIRRAFRPEIEAAIYGIADPVTGQIVKSGVFDDVALGKIAEQIRDAYGKNTIAANEFQGFANTLKNSTDPTSLSNARSRIADEMTAAYTGKLFDRSRAGRFNPDRLPLVYRKVLSAIEDGVLDKFRSVLYEKGMDLGFDNASKTFRNDKGKPIRIPELDAIVRKAFAQKLNAKDATTAKPDLIPTKPADRALWAKTYGGARGILNDDGTPKSQRQIDAEAAARWQDMTMRLSALPDSEKIGIDFNRDKSGKTVMTAKGQLSPSAINAILDSGALDPTAKAVLVEILNSMQNAEKSTFDTRYYGVYTRGKGGNKMVAGVKSASQNEILPYSVEINSKDGVLIRAVDMSKVRDRLATAMNKPQFKSAYSNPADAIKDLRRYMENITQINAVDSAILLGGGAKGAMKRNLFYEALGFRLRNGETLLNAPDSVISKSQNTIKSYRAERFAKLVDSGYKFGFEEATSLERATRNFQPDSFTPEALPNGESFTNKEGYRILNKTGSKLFRTYDDTGKLIGVAESKEKAMKKAQDEFATQAIKQKKLNEGIIDTELNKVIPVKGEKDLVILTPESMKRFQPVGDVSLDELHGQFAMVIPADRMRRGRFNVGPIGKEREASVIAQGGPAFIEEHPNAAWAWTTKAKADGTLARARAQAKPGEKDFLLAVTLQGQEASLSNKTTQRAYKEALEAAVDSKLVSRKDMDAFIEEIYGEVHNLTKGSKDKENQTPAIRSLNELLKTPEFAIKPGGVLRDVLLKKRTDSIIPFVEQEKIGIAATQLAQQVNDPRFTNLPNGTIVALVRIPLDAQPKRTGFHYSYDWEIQGTPVGYLKDPISASGLIGDYQSVVFPRDKFSSHIALGTQPRLVGLDAYIEQTSPKKVSAKSPTEMRFQPVTPEQDAAFLAAAKAGDTKAAQRLVDDAINENLPVGFYHGGNAGEKGFIVQFIKGRPDESYWGGKTKDRALWQTKANRTLTKDMIEFGAEYFGLDTQKAEKLMNPENIVDTAGAWDDPQFVSEFWQRFENDLIRNGDAFEVGNGAIAFPGSENVQRISDPITYDDAGNIIPLSQRFNQASPDIRFQPDPTSPNILNGSNGSRIIKSNSGKYRVYLATGALAGIKDTLESAQKLVETKSK